MAANVFESKITELSKTYDKALVEETYTFASAMFKRLSNRLTITNEELKDIDIYWIDACAKEILRRNEMLGCIKYSENGYSFEFDDAMLSMGLRSLIFADVGVPS